MSGVQLRILDAVLRKGNIKSTDSKPGFFVKMHQYFLIIIDLTVWTTLNVWIEDCLSNDPVKAGLYITWD